MLRKLKKALPAIISAVLCVTMALGITASAASVWSDAKALTTAKYNSNYIKWVEKYSEKSTKNTVTFGKSRTKKFFDKQIKAIKGKDPQFSVSIVNKEALVSIVYKGSNIKLVMAEEDMGIGMYMTPKKITMLSVGDKQKVTIPVSQDMGYDDIIDEMLDSFMNFDGDDYYAELGIAENAKGKLFKFTSGEKTYYYEEFKSSEYDKFGFLFTEKGTPIAMRGDDIIACFNISYKVDDSEFTVPKGYKETDADDFDLGLGSLL